MNQLVKVTNENNRITVLGRDLHIFLEIETEYKKWFSRMCEYGFEEGKDYIRVTQKCLTLGGEQEMVNHQLTLDMAKELSMIQRTDKGKQARQYFIECEKQLLKPKSIEDLIIMQAQSVKELKEKVNILEEKQNKLEAKLITRQEDFFSVAGYCSLNGIKKTSTDYITYGKKCVALSKQLGITVGTVPDAKHGKVNIYHIDVLKSIIEG